MKKHGTKVIYAVMVVYNLYALGTTGDWDKLIIALAFVYAIIARTALDVADKLIDAQAEMIQRQRTALTLERGRRWN